MNKEEIEVIRTKEPNATIRIGENTYLFIRDNYNWFQKLIIKFLLGWKIERIK